MQLYQTDNMENAVRAMSKRVRQSVIHEYYLGSKRVRLRTKKLTDVPLLEVHPWLEGPTALTVAKWVETGGVLYMKGSTRFLNLPDCDALLYVEAPLSMRSFEIRTAGVRDEVIVYRPPTWKYHTVMVEDRHPHIDLYRAAHAFLLALRGRHVSGLQAEALRLSGFDPATSSVFTLSDVQTLLDARAMLRGWCSPITITVIGRRPICR